MSSLYTPQVREFIYSRNWPKGLVLEVFESDDPAPHLNIVFFLDNWLTLSPDQHQQAVNIVHEVLAKLWGDGIPTYPGRMETANYADRRAIEY